MLVVSTYLVMTANGGMFLLVVSLKQMAGDFGWPRTVSSLAYALFFAGTGIGGIAMGYWLGRSGAGPVTLLGLTMIGTGAVFASSIDSRWQLYVVYGVMIGLLGYASIYGPLSIDVMRWFEHRRGFAAGVVTAGEGIGGTLWPPVFRHSGARARASVAGRGRPATGRDPAVRHPRHGARRVAGRLHLRRDRQLHARVPGRSGVQRRQPDHRPRPHRPYAGRWRHTDAAGSGASGGPGDFGRRRIALVLVSTGTQIRHPGLGSNFHAESHIQRGRCRQIRVRNEDLAPEDVPRGTCIRGPSRTVRRAEAAGGAGGRGCAVIAR